MKLVPVIGSIALWTGAFIGLLKLVDWFLSARQKEKLAFWAAALWVWLDDQRLGRFVSAVRSSHSQRVLSLTAHCIVTLIVLSFLGRVFLGWSVPLDIYIGTPRLYIFQVWIDVTALFCRPYYLLSCCIRAYHHGSLGYPRSLISFAALV